MEFSVDTGPLHRKFPPSVDAQRRLVAFDCFARILTAISVWKISERVTQIALGPRPPLRKIPLGANAQRRLAVVDCFAQILAAVYRWKLRVRVAAIVLGCRPLLRKVDVAFEAHF